MTSWICAARQAAIDLVVGGVGPRRSAGCRARVSWNRCGSWLTTPMASLQAGLGEVAHVVAVDAHRAVGHVVEARDERGERGLAGARRPDERDELARARSSASMPRRTKARRPRSLDAAVDVGLERRQRDLAGRAGSGTRRRRSSMLPGGLDEVDGARAVGDRVGRVEHLEDAVERDERRHDVDAGVGEAGERCVDAGDVGRHGDERADADRAADHRAGRRPSRRPPCRPRRRGRGR